VVTAPTAALVGLLAVTPLEDVSFEANAGIRVNVPVVVAIKKLLLVV